MVSSLNIPAKPDVEQSTDSDLLIRFRAGDDSALSLLFSRYEGEIFRFLIGMLRDHHQAEDVLQETFILAIRKSEQVSPQTLRGWLFTVAHQQAVLAKRKQKRYSSFVELFGILDVSSSQNNPEYQAIQKDDSAKALALLSQLPDMQQSVIKLRIFEGLRFQDLANRLDIPLGTALARMHDGLQKMRLLWEDQHA
jgi:RNA polymerase sigma-70 factor, ECF subfamily